MIYLWHSSRGVPYDMVREGQEELGEKMQAAVAEHEPTILTPGKHSLTTGFQEKSLCFHEIRVWEDGRGVFVTVPVRLRWRKDEKTSLFLPKKRARRASSVVIPEQSPFMMVALQEEDPAQVRIVDFVYYHPDEEEEEEAFLPLSFSMN